jgi:rhamnogalacturonyl hydrolase YesR
VIQSWNKSQKWDCPVIVDNMMNLELLFLASKISGDPRFANIAKSHANKTNSNHFRPDGSSYHVLNYDRDTGTVTARNTHQGLADESSWARGQAWGLYGFTMAFRETGNKDYLERAVKIADFIIDHPNVPDDGVPYWDLDVVPDDEPPRDASAAAITAAALLELQEFAERESSQKYLHHAELLLTSLSSPEYLAPAGTNNGFLIMHAVGSLPHDSEIDSPLNYADYYFLEALYRWKQLQ